MSTNRTKRILLAIVIGIIAIVLTLLSKISLAADSNSSSTNTEVVSEITTTATDGDREVTSYHKFYMDGVLHQIADGEDLYCIQHGIIFGEGDGLSLEEALEYGDLDGNPVYWPQTHAYHRSFAHNGETTNSILLCTGDHVQLADEDPALAYILTYPGDWSFEKQFAVWGTDYAASQGSDSESSSISPEAESYDDFFSETSTADGATTTDTRIDEEDLTDDDDVGVAVDYNEQTLIIGPFSIDYIYGAYDDTGVAFGGISDMYLTGYNSSGEVVQDRIEIDKYIYNGKEYSLEFFDPEDDSYVDYSDQSYPKGASAGEDEFYVKIKNPNSSATSDSNSVTKVQLHVEFEWMSASAYICDMDAHIYKVQWGHTDTTHTHTSGDTTINCYYCRAYSWLEDIPAQDHVNVLQGTRKLYEASLDVGPQVDLTMELGGIVWEDAVTTKESKADGVNNTDGDLDIRLKNVKVTLYDSDGNIVDLLADEDSASGDEIYHRINPTYTDENGEYLFEGLDPLKKYYVVFEYNGQQYLPTEYLNTADGQYNSVDQMVNAGLYNTDEWEVNSKGTEAEGTSSIAGVNLAREEFDERYAEITAYSENYPSSNSLGVVGDYNATFTQKDLMGYTLDDDGYYQKTGTQLVDGYEFDENGNETTTYSEGVISQKVREYIEANKEYPDDDAMLQIYTEIANSSDDSTETWMKLQFIEDCQIQAYSGSPFSHEIDYYPVYDQFYINNSGDGNYNTSTLTIAGVDYYPIYPGQYYVNLGLWSRQEYDAALRKDVFKAALKINGKTLTYDYNKRTATDEDSANSGDGQDNDTYWDINVRMSDYENYYGIGYNRDLYDSDYEYDNSDHPGDKLSAYVTYQVAVSNQSMTIETKIKEIVDYYDEDYTYKPDLSWATLSYYKNTGKTVTDNYYNMMANSQTDLDNNAVSADDYMSIDDENYLYADMSAGDSIRSSTNKELDGLNNLYIHPIDDLQLETGETVYLYLTFQVNYDDDGLLMVDSEDNTPKYNIAEINAYETYYRDGTELPNSVEKNSDDVAGLIDRDSNPGNLVQEDLEGDKYEKNFEDDTDEAPALNINLVEEERQLNGYVWEDERNYTLEDSLIGDGIMEDDETKVAGVTVQLWELCTDGETIWVWDETTTDENGYYEFDGFIPGNYVVHFIYGEDDETALSTESLGRTGLNVVSYNGQDFKSTTYQAGIEQDGYTDLDDTYQAYVDTANQNEGIYTQTDSSYYYGYDIYETDLETDAGYNYSDAKDIWSRREAVIDYSDTDVTNHVAEVLASPYEVPEYNGEAYTEDQMGELYDELEENTYMEAETGVITMEIEYNRQTSDGDDDVVNNGDTSSQESYLDNNGQNGNYVVRNVDLGLEERPKSQLEIDKSVSNITVTLVNNTVLFDINAEADNALWTDHQEYNVGEIKDEYDGIYPTYYDSETAYPKGTENANLYYHRYSYRDIVNDQLVPNTDKGLIQITMDEELMQGATIQITYSIKVTNVGETDYVDDDTKDFYYRGEYTGDETVSETTTNQVLDYVQNNLRFDETATNNAYNAVNGEEDTERRTNSENGWAVIDKSDIMSNGLVNENLSEQVDTFIDVIQTEGFAEQALTPGESITKTLLLSQQISSQNTSDDLSYGNMVEIVKTSNTVGRRMAYSTVGNQNPTDTDAGEIDANIAESVVILPPFGEDRFTYLIGILVGAVLIAGIVLIRKKVLGRGDKGDNSGNEPNVEQ